MNESRGSAGFTLIELLIVIIIIGVLAAIAIPMFLIQRDRAKDASVKSGTHMIEVGLGSFGVDHLDQYPAALADKDALVDDNGLPYVDAWPKNPWKGLDMVQSGDPGDYTYQRLGTGSSFSLAGHMSTGDFVVP